MEFQGLRSPKNRSLLKVNEDFEGKCNAEITTTQNAYKITILDVFRHGFGHNKSTSTNEEHIVRL